MTLTVTQLVDSIKSIVDSESLLQGVSIEGEISNLTQYRSGHWYFSLKDDGAKINCVMFSRSNGRVNFKPKDGDKIIAKGNVSVYVNSGQLQLIVTSMTQAGLGDLHAQYLLLRDKLYKQGYFDPSKKKELVKYPLSIGVIAGANSAALADILQTLKKRWPIAKVSVYPSLVQGQSAPPQLIVNLKLADKSSHDVIILARGGGSLEDLWAFNNEELVIAIYETETPVVTGVGHEIDVTLVDYVADQRGLTPTAAAQLVTPDQDEVFQVIDTYENHLRQVMSHKLQQQKTHLNYLSNASVLTKPQQLIVNQQLLVKNLSNTLLRKGNQFITQHKQQINQHQNQIMKLQNDLLRNKQHHFALMVERLNLLSPLSIMSKGYLLSFQDEKLIQSRHDINEHKPIELQYHDGKIIVQKVKENKDGQ